MILNKKIENKLKIRNMASAVPSSMNPPLDCFVR
ncbi:uncharacterized protein METZ01_LOCUS248992 [marine metagenome]|uniref:Uncharacterized protein n=1 Tax=marine metagenome TaxID=408172 RepID=A0A382I9E5_9ZZZZ